MRSISTKLGTKHFWVKEIHEGPRPFSRGDNYEFEDNYETAKIHRRNLKSASPEPL